MSPEIPEYTIIPTHMWREIRLDAMRTLRGLDIVHSVESLPYQAELAQRVARKAAANDPD